MREYSINGVISTPIDVKEDEFLDILLEFLESKGWGFGGMTGEIISDIESI